LIHHSWPAKRKPRGRRTPRDEEKYSAAGARVQAPPAVPGRANRRGRAGRADQAAITRAGRRSAARSSAASGKIPDPTEVGPRDGVAATSRSGGKAGGVAFGGGRGGGAAGRVEGMGAVLTTATAGGSTVYCAQTHRIAGNHSGSPQRPCRIGREPIARSLPGACPATESHPRRPRHNLKNCRHLRRHRLVVITRAVSGSGKFRRSPSTRSMPRDSAATSSSRCRPYARQFWARWDARRRLDRGTVPGDLDRAEGRRRNPALHGGHAHRDLRLPAPAVRPPRHGRHCPNDARNAPFVAPDRERDGRLSLRRPTRREGTQSTRPIIRGRKGEYRQELDDARKAGYLRARIDGKPVELEEGMRLAKTKRHHESTSSSTASRSRRRTGAGWPTRSRRRWASPLGVAAVGGDQGRGPPVQPERRPCTVCGSSYEELCSATVLVQTRPTGLPRMRRPRHQLEVDPPAGDPDPSLSIADGAIPPGAGSTTPWHGGQMRAPGQAPQVSTRDSRGRSCRRRCRRRFLHASATSSCTTPTSPSAAGRGSSTASSRACLAKPCAGATSTPRPSRGGARSPAT